METILKLLAEVAKAAPIAGAAASMVVNTVVAIREANTLSVLVILDKADAKNASNEQAARDFIAKFGGQTPPQ